MPTSTERLTTARAEVKRLGELALKVCADAQSEKITQAAAIKRLQDEIEPAIFAAEKEFHLAEDAADREGLGDARRKLFGGIGMDQLGGDGSGATQVMHRGYQTASAPALGLTEEDARDLYDAITHRKSFRRDATVKVASGTVNNPAALHTTQILPPVGMLREPTRVLDLIPLQASDAPVVEYYVQTAAAVATVVAEGALKPGSNITTPKQLATAAKIAGWVDVTDEMLEDFSAFLGFVTSDLSRAVIDAENLEALSGTGIAPRYITGLLNSAGLTRAYPTTPPTNYTGLDTLRSAQSDLRTGPAFAEVEAWVMTPRTLSSLQQLKDTMGRYLLDPGAGASLWGKPVTQTTEMTDGTILGGSFTDSTRGWVRKGLSVTASNGGTTILADGTTASAFKANVTTVLGEERVGMYVYRPAGLIKVTGIPVAA